MSRGATEWDSVANEIRELRVLSRRITAALITIAVVAMVFTAASVTRFAIGHDVSVWIAWTLDPMVAGALLTVLLVDARLVELGTAPAGWATALRWFAGLGTWVMNVWSSVWPDGGFGVPTEVDAAGVVLHSIPPVLLIVLAEAATGYRRVIADRIRHLEGRAAVAGGTHGVGTPGGLADRPDPRGSAGNAGRGLHTRTPRGYTPAGTPRVSMAVDTLKGLHSLNTLGGAVVGGVPTTADHLRGAAHMAGERSAGHADPWSGAGPHGVVETTDRVTIDVTTGPTTSVVAPVVDEPVVSGPPGGRADDRQHDQADASDDVRPVDAMAVDDECDSPSAAKGVGTVDTPALSPVELRRRARRMHRDAVASTRRPVTIEALQSELGLSRRAAAELRREVVALNGVARH
ncbi:hypothetical protein [Embleya sp. NPDC059259]|uniref:hypothetical protein n=1 Tax=unclassified Embleya TaxID=2699296 RepID=UPI00368A209C